MTSAKQSFPPLIGENSNILILGTLPSEDSLKFQQYYGHKRNAFWRIMGELIDTTDLSNFAYEAKCETLVKNGFSLWDTIASANRKGSLDNAIREPVYNDIPALILNYPHTHTIGFNGKSARKFFKPHEKNLPRDILLCDLPSSSPAYTLSFEDKLSLWRAQLSYSKT